jgi:hypothetical protein
MLFIGFRFRFQLSAPVFAIFFDTLPFRHYFAAFAAIIFIIAAISLRFRRHFLMFSFIFFHGFHFVFFAAAPRHYYCHISCRRATPDAATPPLRFSLRFSRISPRFHFCLLMAITLAFIFS